MIKIIKGLDLLIAGTPIQTILDSSKIQHVALLGQEYVAMRPSILVQEGDTVKKGRHYLKINRTLGLFSRHQPAGRIISINRGERRILQLVVIALEDSGARQLAFAHYPA